MGGIDEIGKIKELIDNIRGNRGTRNRTTYYVDHSIGSGNYDGLTPESAFLNINDAIAVADDGDIIRVAEDTYDEAVSIPAGKLGLSVICEPGVYIINSTPGTAVTIASPEVYWEGGTIEINGQTAMEINDDWCIIKGVRVYNSNIGFDINGDHTWLIDCVTNETAASGFDISEDSCYLIDCLVHGAAASRGFYLSHTNAHNNTFMRCSTVGCTAGGYEAVAGADENIFVDCAQSSLCSGPTDAGANNTWTRHTNQQMFIMDFWSTPEDAIDVDNVATDIALPDVTVTGIPNGARIVRAVAMFKFRMIEETSGGANALDGAQEIQVRDDTPGAWADAINMIADQFTLAADAREGGDCLIGAINISGTVDGNDTYNFQWDEALADADDITFNDIQVGLRVWYTI